MNPWKTKWGYELQATSAPGIYKVKTGGWLVHGKVGPKKARVMELVREGTIRDAVLARALMLENAKARLQAKSSSGSRPLFAEYARSLLERKIIQRELKSAKSIERWTGTLDKHLVPAFGRSAVDVITKLDIEAWKTSCCKKLIRPGRKKRKGEISPATINGWLSILLNVLRTAVVDLKLDYDPTLRVHTVSTAEHPTYTKEKPNSLTVEQARVFLAAMHEKFPQFYAMTLLGFTTGLRPSTMRALRHRGRDADVSWMAGTIEVRRSHSLGDEAMNTTKTDNRYPIGLPLDVMRVLRSHVDAFPWESGKTSNLLFPSRVAPPKGKEGFIARSVLDRPFGTVSTLIGLPSRVTPRAMRRTYQDLCRDAKVPALVQQAVCGHDTDEMSEHYSTVRPDEMRAELSKLTSALLAAPSTKTRKKRSKAA